MEETSNSTSEASGNKYQKVKCNMMSTDTTPWIDKTECLTQPKLRFHDLKQDTGIALQLVSIVVDLLSHSGTFYEYWPL